MKKYLLLALIAMAFPSLTLAQATDTIPKKTDAIGITTGMTLDQNFDLVSNFLTEKDYTIEQLRKETGQIITGEVPIKTINYKFRFLIKEDKIRLTGDYELQGMNLGWSRIKNIGAKGSPSKIAFQTLVDLAQKITPQGQISFSVIE